MTQVLGSERRDVGHIAPAGRRSGAHVESSLGARVPASEPVRGAHVDSSLPLRLAPHASQCRTTPASVRICNRPVRSSTGRSGVTTTVFVSPGSMSK